MNAKSPSWINAHLTPDALTRRSFTGTKMKRWNWTNFYHWLRWYELFKAKYRRNTSKRFIRRSRNLLKPIFCYKTIHAFRCECIKPYVNSAPPGELKGSECKIDYCSDVNYCPMNSTCKNGKDGPECICEPGYMDLRQSLDSEKLAEVN